MSTLFPHFDFLFTTYFQRITYFAWTTNVGRKYRSKCRKKIRSYSQLLKLHMPTILEAINKALEGHNMVNPRLSNAGGMRSGE